MLPIPNPSIKGAGLIGHIIEALLIKLHRMPANQSQLLAYAFVMLLNQISPHIDFMSCYQVKFSFLSAATIT